MDFDRAAERTAGRRLLFVLVLVGTGLLIGVLSYRAGRETMFPAPASAPRTLPPTSAAFEPPDEAAVPPGPDGDAIRRGKAVFTQTTANAARYVGNGLVCSNCHLDAGRRADAAPMWAAWGVYPAYRAKNHRIDTMEDRIRDCFLYSLNAPASPSAGPPPLGDDIYRDLQTYFAWLANGIPAGSDVVGRGYPKLPPPQPAFDPARGANVFADRCAPCHGANGEGQASGSGGYAVPPLWGAHSFNWGAGMATVASAAAFIKQNMPLGQGKTLTDQQAWDVAAFIDSHERPRDPARPAASRRRDASTIPQATITA